MTLLPDDADVGRGAPRRDVSEVPAQDGGIVRRCPTAVSLDVRSPAVLATSPDAADAASGPRHVELDQLRRGERVQHRAEALDLLRTSNPTAVVIDRARSDSEQVAATVDAIDGGAELIVDGRLPADEVHRRAGRPVILVQAEQRADGARAYHPVEIRNHRTLDVAKPTADPHYGPTISGLAQPAHALAQVDVTHRARSHTGDLGWLAHTHRMLEAAGHASADAWGGVIGPELVIVWHRLDLVSSQHRWDRRSATEESVLDRYDQEFSFRLDVLAADAAGTPIVGPVSVGECARCRWNPHCRPQIEAADSTSLLPGFGFRQWYHLARQGITTRAQVAALDLATAALRDAIPSPLTLDALVAAAEDDSRAEVADLVLALAPEFDDEPAAGAPAAGSDPAVASVPGGKRRSEVAPGVDEERAASGPGGGPGASPRTEPDEGPTETERFVSKVLHRLAAHGIAETADLVALDPTVVGLAPLPVRGLADAIEGARAQVSGRPQLRRNHQRLAVPGADLEIDLDMESSLDGTVYLWGALADGDYHAEVSWAPPGPVVDAEVFVRFWDWLTAVRAGAAETGRSVACYCWFRGAESGALRAGARAAQELLDIDHTEAVEAFLAGPEFVDLYEVFTRQLVTGTSAGLKVVATMAGFAWRDEDPNGAASMAWHAQAVEATGGEARARLLAYNEDDVRATAAVRAWMRADLGGLTA